MRAELVGQADLVLGAECALALGASDVAERYVETLVSTLGHSLANREWLDLGLASDVLRVLTQLVFAEGRTSPSNLECLEYAVEPVLGWLCGRQVGQTRPTSMRVQAKSLHALESLSRLSPLPVMTLVETLDESQTAGLKRLRRDAGSDLVESLRVRHAALEERSKTALEAAAAMRRKEDTRRRRLMPMRLLGVCALYVLVTVAIAGASESPGGWRSLWEAGFGEHVGVHIGVIGVVLTGAGAYLAWPAYRDSRRSGGRGDPGAGERGYRGGT